MRGTTRDRLGRLALGSLLFVLAACGDSPASLGAPDAGAWPTATPESVGLADAPLVAIRREIRNGDYGGVQSLLVVRDGRLVFEEYFNAGSREALNPVYSVTKSVASTLVGMARDQGLFPDLDRPLLEFFPRYPTVENPDGKEAITFGHALAMRAGFQWDELGTNYSNGLNPTLLLAASPDWVKFVLDLPLVDAPGARFTYNSGVSVLLAGALEEVTGEETEDFAQDHLWGPLGIGPVEWSRTSDGLANAGWGLRMRARDMARLGQLYLQDGIWDGERLLSSEWIAEATDAGTVFANDFGYGFQWWLAPGAPGRPGEPAIPYAQGWGGQFVLVVPHLDMVLVTTQANFDQLRGLDAARLLALAEAAARG